MLKSFKVKTMKTRRLLAVLLLALSLFTSLSISSVPAQAAGSIVGTAPTRTLRKGCSGSDVLYVQRVLNLALGAGIKEDSIFGTETETYVRKYQQKFGLGSDGVVGNITAKSQVAFVALKVQNKYPVPSRTIKKGCVGADCGWIQSVLNLYGANIQVDQNIGSASVNAIKSFQRRFSVAGGADGIAGANTRNKMISLVNSLAVYNTQNTQYSQNNPVKANLQKVSGIAQVQNMCTSCAVGTLLRRQQVLNGKAATITFADIRTQLGSRKNGNTWTQVSFYFNGKNGNGWKFANGESYTVKKVQTPRTQAALKNLLDMYPAGVVVYGYYNHSSQMHAITVSDYVVNANGSITFYAYDPAVNGGNRVKLTETSLVKYSANWNGTGGSVDKMLNNLYSDRGAYVVGK